MDELDLKLKELESGYLGLGFRIKHNEVMVGGHIRSVKDSKRFMSFARYDCRYSVR